LFLAFCSGSELGRRGLSSTQPGTEVRPLLSSVMLSLCPLRPPRLRCFARTALVVLLGLRHAASPAASRRSARVVATAGRGRGTGGGRGGGGEEEEGRGGVGGEEIKLRGRGLREIRRGGELRGAQ